MTEHQAMLSCPCNDSDRLMVFCLACGKSFLPDPSYLVIALAVVMFGANLVYWIAL